MAATLAVTWLHVGGWGLVTSSLFVEHTTVYGAV